MEQKYSQLTRLLPEQKGWERAASLIESSGDNVEIRGEKRNRRRMLNSIIFEESQLSFFNMDALQDSFGTIDIDYITETVNLKVLVDSRHDKRTNPFIPQISQSISFKKTILLPDTVLAGG